MSNSTKHQISILSEFMEKHPELARSYNTVPSSGRATQRQLWEKLTRLLNSNGPPTKTVAEWKRVWTLRKYSTKKKLIFNKKSIKQTGGGPFDLKPLEESEEAIIIACGMEASVSGVEGSLAFGTSEKENDEQVVPSIEQLLEDLVGTPENKKDLSDVPPSSKKGKKNSGEDEILKKQLDLQQNFFSKQIENANKANTTLSEIRDAIRELCVSRKEEAVVSNNLKKEELEIRKRELEIAKIKNDLKLMEINMQQK